jgi:U4/U6.U5 tri-snRNP-associated protein 1
MMKADDLLATAPNSAVNMKQEPKIKSEPIETSAINKTKSDNNKKISLKDIDFGFSKNDSDKEEGEYKEEEEDDEDEDDEIDLNRFNENENEELKQILEQENNQLDELHSVLSKTRNRVTSSILNSNKIVNDDDEQIANLNETETNKVVFENLNTIVEYNDEDNAKNKALTLDTMSEFCRNLGDMSNSNNTNINKYIERKKDLDEDEDDDQEETKMVIERIKSKNSKKTTQISNEDEEEEDHDELERNQSVEMKDQDDEVEAEEGFDLLEDEPVINQGLASCLQLAFNKGYIEQEKSKQNARFKKANIEAINITVEEKNYYDIDDKYNRNRDRFSGPLSDFQEKSNYKPDVKLDYIDEKGHAMNEKEAFRYLSHRFHGKGSGKKKTEKQNKKIKEMEAMNKMSSIDTPLNTVALLVEKQKKLQQPFVVLSTAKNKQDQ